MGEQQTVRAKSSEIRDVFGRWLSAEWAVGARIVVLEGLMGSGKSMLTKQSFALGTQQSMSVEVDHFLRKPVDPNTAYMDAIDVEAASASILTALRQSPLVIIEGPMAWPVAQRALQEVGECDVRRVYLKRMSSTRPDAWDDFEFLQEYERPTAYGRSVDQYHATEQPWVRADLILERIGKGDE